jgi:hypothetical protein
MNFLEGESSCTTSKGIVWGEIFHARPPKVSFGRIFFLHDLQKYLLGRYFFCTTSKKIFWTEIFFARPLKASFVGGKIFFARHAILDGLLIFFAKASTIHCGFEEITCFLLVFLTLSLGHPTNFPKNFDRRVRQWSDV